jgi:MFS family permease
LPALTLSIGCLLAGCMMEKFGRKRTMQIQCIPSFLGWVLLAMSKDVPTLYAGRLLTGFGGGMVDSTIQVTMTALPILQDLMSGESILKGVHRRNHDAATAGRVGVDAVP